MKIKDAIFFSATWTLSLIADTRSFAANAQAEALVVVLDSVQTDGLKQTLDQTEPKSWSEIEEILAVSPDLVISTTPGQDSKCITKVMP